MGMNDLYLDAQSQGYYESDKNPCACCVGDAFITELIEKNNEIKQCDFCKKRAKTISVNCILERFMRFICFFYDRAVESCPVEHGEYLLPTIDVYELADDYLNVKKDNLFEFLKDQLVLDEVYCEKLNDYGNEIVYSPLWMWNEFSRQLKHEMRFFFWRNSDHTFHDEPLPYSILFEISKNVEFFNFVKKIPEGTSLFRARSGNNFPHTPQALGAAPDNIAPDNRMSPAGISLFYSSSDFKTCLSEVRESQSTFTVGEWVTCHDMLFLDLSQYLNQENNYHLPNISIFDSDNLDKIPIRNFFADFLSDVNKKIDREDLSKRYEYVPTQVVAEFFRHIYRTSSGEKLSGIIYPSCQNPEGKNFVIFCGQRGCLPPERTQFVKLKTIQTVD